MVTFFICLGILILGYFTYGKTIDRNFSPDDRETPAVRNNDGVDYVVMPQWKLYLIQLLNIAGIGPIFGALQGAMWGPVVFLWITFGSIFAGGVHDYFSGMVSLRHNGATIAEISGIYLGKVMQNVLRVFSVILLILVGTVFAVSPAGLLRELFSESGNSLLTSIPFWLAVIFLYYFLSTFLPVDKVIGRLYPVFGVVLIVMAVGVCFGVLTNPNYEIPEIWNNFTNMHADGKAFIPYMFITVACGAISGFHSTQSPLMARCMKSERQGHSVFYGAMISEGIIALIWAAAGCAIYETTGGLNTGLAELLKNSTQAEAVYDVCEKTMPGIIGTTLAVVGVMACPITSGDTAFRSARLVIADWFHLEQKGFLRRLLLCIPILGIGIFLGFAQAYKLIDYSIIWRYFSWSNQTLAMIVLWTAATYLYKNNKNYWIAAIPAVFMTYITTVYLFNASECLNLDTEIAYPVGLGISAIILIIFLRAENNFAKGQRFHVH